jgi:hypothetical protein
MIAPPLNASVRCPVVVNPIAISTAAAAVLTPGIMAMWAKLTPPKPASEFDALGPEALRQRNRWLDHAFTLFMFVGLCYPVPILQKYGSPSNIFPMIGVAFGSMVVTPVVFVTLCTLPKGIARVREFWRFYETRWGIGLRGIAWVYTFVALVGFGCLIDVVLGT